MIRIRIGKRHYRGAYSWEDITLKQFARLAAVDIPQSYRQWALADGKYDPDHPEEFLRAVEGITDEDVNERFPKFYRAVIDVLTNIPAKIIYTLTDEQAESLYNRYLRHFVFSLIYHAPMTSFMGQITDYRPADVCCFRVGLRWYFLPSTVNVAGEQVTLFNEPSRTYSEAADIFSSMQFTAEDISRLALFMGIYCRRFGERYDERKALRRQETMLRVKMSTVWSVFFYTLSRLPGSTGITALYGSLPRRMTELRSAVQTWRSMEAVRSSTKRPDTEGLAHSQTLAK